MAQMRSKRWLSLSFACCLMMGCASESDTNDDDTDESADEAKAQRDAGEQAANDAASEPDTDSNSDGSEDADDDGDAGEPTGSADAGEPDEDSDTSVDAPLDDAASLLPLAEGNTWTYRVMSGTETLMKVTIVGALEKVGGTGPNKDKMAFKVTTMKGPMDKTVSWQAVVGASAIRYRELAYSASTGEPELEEHWSPHKLRVHSDQEHTTSGTKWVESYEETKTVEGAQPVTAPSADNWSVDATKVSVTVPAGTFEAVVLMKASPSGTKTYWYVPGVGKVKEMGGQTEELVSYELAD